MFQVSNLLRLGVTPVGVADGAMPWEKRAVLMGHSNVSELPESLEQVPHLAFMPDDESHVFSTFLDFVYLLKWHTQHEAAQDYHAGLYRHKQHEAVQNYHAGLLQSPGWHMCWPQWIQAAVQEQPAGAAVNIVKLCCQLLEAMVSASD